LRSVYGQAELGFASANPQGRLSDDTSTSPFSHFAPERAFAPIVPIRDYILIPFFFASIGAAIPVKDLFEGQAAWRGIVYTVLMFLGKLAAGGWVLVADAFGHSRRRRRSKAGEERDHGAENGTAKQASSETITVDHQAQDQLPATDESAAKLDDASRSQRTQLSSSLSPAIFLGLSLVARGEIGFLILAIAREGGIVGQETNELSLQAYNVAVWAIVLNTFFGPLLLGVLLRFTRFGERIGRSRWN
jgi:hypothetical protein